VAQKALGVDAPFFGVLLSHSSHTGAGRAPRSDFTVRCPEAESGSRWPRTCPPGPAYTAAGIRPFVGAVLPALEVVDHRYHDWRAAARRAARGQRDPRGVVFGAPATVHGWQELDFAALTRRRWW
jgi:2-keto-4-pentenoate hydratase